MPLTDRCFIFFAIGLLGLFGCGKSNSLPTPHSQQDSIENKAVTLPDTENVFKRYDKIQKLVEAWNAAIDGQNPESLESVYMDSVEYYGKFQPAVNCIQSKKKWFQTHPTYHPKIDQLSVYYSDEDTLGIWMYAKFAKLCIEGSDTQEVITQMAFKKKGGAWKMQKETDIPTEISLAKKSPAGNLQPGEQVFRFGYWTDTRGMEGFAHDEVPYWSALTLQVGDQITGKYEAYSGTMREITTYLVPEVQVKNGILEVFAIYNEMDELSLEDYLKDRIPAKEEHWHYKMVNGKELINVDENSYRYGDRLILTN